MSIVARPDERDYLTRAAESMVNSVEGQAAPMYRQ